MAIWKLILSARYLESYGLETVNLLEMMSK